MLKANRKQMKEINKNNLRQILKERRKATKPEMSELTELSVVTVNGLIGEMVSSGEVIEGDEIPSNGGRPSKQYIYNGNYRKVIIIYGYREKNYDMFHMLIMNSFGECIDRKKACETNVVTKSFDLWIADAFKKHKNICAIVFGLPGAENNGVIYANDYPGIIGDQFLSYFKEKYQVPVIYENDINATVYGFYARKNEETTESMVGLYYPRAYAPGAGIVINGEIYKGCMNFAGEVGYIPLNPPWNEVDYDNKEEIIFMLSQIAVVFSCVLAPERIVFYGDFLTEEILKELEERLTKILHGKFLPLIAFENNLVKDFEWGLVQIGLSELKRKEGMAAWL